jgi:hypothetical protein
MRKGLIPLAVLLSAIPALILPASAEELEERVRQAALITYFHGMTDEIAGNEAGVEAVPQLLELLEDPQFPRRDNVVAFLAHLYDGRAVPALERLLERPPAPVTRPEELRSLLLAPKALGRIARAGDRAALELLLEMTAPESQGGPLARGVAAGSYSPALRDRLVEAALKGLALSASERSRQRLRQIRDNLAAPVLVGRDLRTAAARALELSGTEYLGYGPAAGLLEIGPPSSGAGAVTRAADPALASHDHELSYASHVDITFPPTSSDVASNFDFGTRVAATADFSEDVACCTSLSPTQPGLTFGNADDGLAIIDSEAEAGSVLNQSLARVKIVEEINYCAGPGTNIIGCSWLGGPSMVVVRISADEGVLWLHEYGHNLGLDHVNDDRYVMFSSLRLNRNRGLFAAECGQFHNPLPTAQAVLTDTGACHDDDLDDIASNYDNCPFNANADQADADADGVGDVCDCEGQDDPDGDGICADADNCPLTANADQLDGDLDGLGDACDPCTDADADGFGAPDGSACPAGAAVDCDDTMAQVFPGSPDLCDGLDNDCSGGVDDTACDAFEFTGDSAVDGAELSWVGRAFGECSATPAVEWWHPADYDSDGCVDGDDLALLASVWACAIGEPACQ